MLSIERTGKKYLLYFLIIWVAQMAAAFYFCTQKQGFHEDEYYTYYSTARTNGFYVEDGQWMDRETYRNEFVVLPGQRFQYGLVRLVQSWDVHPPMYYWVFHTAASLTPDVFSKWTGLSVNLFFHGINIVLLTYLSYLVSRRDMKMALLVTTFYGFSPAAMSGVVFIRMYEMLTTCVLSCALLHMRTVEEMEGKAASSPQTRENRLQAYGLGEAHGCEGEAGLSVWKHLVPMAVVTYIGFLTQYYYFIFLFFLAAAFCIWMLWRERKLWNCLKYGAGQLTALALACLTYPSCLGQMFRGQRGAQATENFFDLSNTLGRLWFFWELAMRYVFGHMLAVFLMVIALLLATAHRRRKRALLSGRIQSDAEVLGADARFGAEAKILLFAVLGYFLTVSKTALLLGETSNRYQLPIYGIAVLLTFVSVKTLWRQVIALSAVAGNSVPGEVKKTPVWIPVKFTILLFFLELLGDLWRMVLAFAMKKRKYTQAAAVLFCLVTIGAGYWFEDVVFLYPEDEGQVAYAREQAAEGTPAVYLYQPGEEWCIWDITNVLLEYPAVCFVSAQGEEAVADERIGNADAAVVYLSKGADADAQLARIRPGADGGTQPVCVRMEEYDEKYCAVYYFCAEPE